MRSPPEPESYVRIWTTNPEAEDAILSLGQEAFDEQGIPVTYIGSARCLFEEDVAKEDQCDFLFGFRGDGIAEAVGFLNSRDEIDASRTQVLEVESWIVNRVAPGPPLDLFDD